MSGMSSRYPFTAAQWQELEHQALFFKFLVSGLPIPPDLIFSINGTTSLTSQPHHIGWRCFQLGVSQNIDPEPTRCRRTDGKKWRCSRQTTGDSKYCERHMHRGKSRPRKLPDSKPLQTFLYGSSSSMVEARRSQQSPGSPTQSNSNLTSLSWVTSNMTHHHLFNTHLSKPVKGSTFMTFFGIESGWSPPSPKLNRSEKGERIMYQFIEESPQGRRDSWLNLVI